MKKILNALIIAGLALAAIPAVAGEKIKVVASFSILGDMVEQVSGDLADVTTIVGPDADAHVYTPSTGDATAVAKADIVFINAMGFETWSQALIENSGTKAKVFVATEGVTEVPEHAAEYKANAEKYTKRLQALHNRAVSELSKLPAEKKTVVTAHDAFGYLEDAYGLTFLAPVGIDTEAEPSAKELAALIDNLKEVGAGALFVENITSPALIEQISRETGIKIGGRLFSDALSERGASTCPGDYLLIIA